MGIWVIFFSLPTGIKATMNSIVSGSRWTHSQPGEVAVIATYKV